MFKITTNNKTNNMSQTVVKLKGIYVALAKAIEEGDNLKIGIVLGQTLKELEDLINRS
jgi:hypothetical protein